MALPSTVSWEKLIIQLGGGETPTELFTAPCILTTRGFGLSATTADVAVPDCTDPNLPAWVQRAIREMSGEITGSGLLDSPAFATWRTWFLSGAAKNIRIKIDVPLAASGGHFAGSFVLTRLEIGSDRGDPLVNLSGVTLASNGPITWVAASA